MNIIGNDKGLDNSKILFVNNKAAALNGLGRYSEAVRVLNAWDEPTEMMLKNYGNAYFGLGHYEKAI